MSGEYFDYLQYRLQDITNDIEKVIEHNNEKDEWDYTTNFSEETLQEFKTGIELIKKTHIYMQRIDYLLSGDDGEESFHKRLKEELETIK